MRRSQIERILEIIPASLSWSIIIFFILVVIFNPILASLIFIIYLLYWFFRFLYMTVLLVIAHHRMISKKDIDWLGLCKESKTDKDFEDIFHVVLYTIYKEPFSVILDSLSSLKNTDYPKDKFIVVLAGEEREKNILDKLEKIKEEFKKYFKDIIITIHPKDLEGEIPCKGANATYSAKIVKKYLEENKIDLENVIISCFDADTCVDSKYFSCLTYHFLNNPKRYRLSYQPLPIYNNNIYYASALARVIEFGSTFWQLIESMRWEKFVTFSSHSLSFKTLVDIDYWPRDKISDDSLIFWKAFVKFNGDYATYSLEVPVYMDIAVGKNIFDTIKVQYKQKRRWAWGVEAFVYLGVEFLNKKEIPLSIKIKKLLQVLDSHINWATWSIIISFLLPVILLWIAFGKKNELIFFNLSYINTTIWHTLTFILIICLVISKEFLPPKPKNVSKFFYFSFIFQWFLIPLVSALLGSFPALDAQTRMMFNKKIKFNPTPKERINLNSLYIINNRAI